MVENYLHLIAPQHLMDCYVPIPCGQSTTSSFRQSSSPGCVRHNLSTYGRRSIAVADPAAWNSLSDDLRDPALSTDSFRRLLKEVYFLSSIEYRVKKLEYRVKQESSAKLANQRVSLCIYF